MAKIRTENEVEYDIKIFGTLRLSKIVRIENWSAAEMAIVCTHTLQYDMYKPMMVLDLNDCTILPSRVIVAPQISYV